MFADRGSSSRAIKLFISTERIHKSTFVFAGNSRDAHLFGRLPISAPVTGHFGPNMLVSVSLYFFFYFFLSFFG